MVRCNPGLPLFLFKTCDRTTVYRVRYCSRVSRTIIFTPMFLIMWGDSLVLNRRRIRFPLPNIRWCRVRRVQRVPVIWNPFKGKLTVSRNVRVVRYLFPCLRCQAFVENCVKFCVLAKEVYSDLCSRTIYVRVSSYQGPREKGVSALHSLVSFFKMVMDRVTR